MKNTIALIWVFTYMSFLYSQEITGVVYDKTSKEKISGILITLIDYEISTKTDSLGKFTLTPKITTSKSIRIQFSGLGYKSLLLNYNITNELIQIELEQDHIELEEMIVTSNQRGSLQKNNINHIEVKRLSDLKSIPSTTLGEALNNMMGVYQSSTAIGISKPVIRGLQGIRVVTLLNGLRIENQQWGGDHGMGVSDLGIGSVEIIKGPASVLYGTDAMGGVLYLVDESYAKQNKQELSVQTQAESNTLGTNNQLFYKIAGKNWRLSTGGLYTNHADYQLPSGKYAGNARYNEQAGKLNFGMNSKNWVMHFKYNFQRNRAGIPGHTHDTIFNPESFKVELQNRRRTIPAQVINNHFFSLENKFFFHRTELSILNGFTSNKLTEFDEKVTIPGINMLLNNTLMNIRLKTQLNENFQILYGTQGMFQQNRNLDGASETLLPSSNTIDVGLYALGIYSKNKWTAQAGSRFDMRSVESFENFKGNEALKRTFSSVNFSVGAVRNGKKSTIRFSGASGYRAPHLTELLANGFHHGALRYEIGNSALKPERATQLEATYEFHHEHVELVFNPFFTNFSNFIYINPQNYNLEGLPVFTYEQMNQAYMFGSDFGFHYHPHFAHQLHLENTFSYIVAEGTNGIKIPLIPQARINSLIKFLPKRKGKFICEQLVLQHVFHFDQTRVAVYETPSKAYHLLNASAQFKFNSTHPLSLTVGVRNILNEQYINHLSRLKNIEMEAPGINFILGLKYNFETVINK